MIKEKRVLKPFWWIIFPTFNRREYMMTGALSSEFLNTDTGVEAASWT